MTPQERTGRRVQFVPRGWTVDGEGILQHRADGVIAGREGVTIMLAVWVRRGGLGVFA
ncbi:hypothetical protein ACWEBX_16965 [Streptomyces sp. NPDC005070]